MAAKDKIKGITIQLNADTAGIMDSFRDINKSLRQTDSALKDVNKLLKLDPDNTELVTQKQEYLTKAIEDTSKRLEEEKKLLESLKTADNAKETVEQQRALERQIAETNVKLGRYQSQLNDTGDALGEVAKDTEKASKESLTFGDILKANVVSDIVVNGIKNLANGIKEVATASLEAGMSFESSMSQVAATMGLTVEEIRNGSDTYEKMAAAAKKMGASTQFSASQAADALNYLALAGYDADKAVETLPSVLTLAAAGGMELAYASDLVTDSMSALGLKTEDLENYIDEMARAAQKSNTSVGQLGEAILVAGGTAKITDQSLESMNAELGVLANVGLKGSEGGTHLRNVLLSLSAPTDKAAVTLKKLNVSATDSVGNMRNLNDIMIDLNEALSDLGSADKAATIKAIFNKTDIAAVNALLDATNGQYDQLVEEMNNASGAAKDMADVMLDNLQGNITILKSALEGLQIAFYEVFDDNAKQAVQAATDALGHLTEAIQHGELGVSLNNLAESFGRLAEDAINAAEDGLPGFIDGLAKLLDHIDELVDVLKIAGASYVAYEAATKAAVIAQKGFVAALDLNPIGLAAGAIAGLAVAYLEISKQATEASRSAQKFADNAKLDITTFESNIQSVKDAAQTIKEYAGVTELLPEDVAKISEAVKTWNANASESAQITTDLNGEIGELTDEMRALIDAEAEEIAVGMQSDALSKIAEERTQAEENLAEAEEEVLRLQKEYQDVLDMGGTVEEYESAKEAVVIYKNSVAELTDEYDELKAGIDEYKASQEASNNTTNGVASSMQETTEEAKTLVETLNELDEAYAENKEKAVESLEAQRDTFAKLSQSAAGDVDTIKTELANQAEGMKRYAQDVADAEAIMEKNPGAEGLLNYYIQQGPAAATELEALVQAFKEGGDSLKDFEEACKSFDETENLINSLGDLNVALSTGSQEAIDMALENIPASLEEMESAFQTSWDTQIEAAETYKTDMADTASAAATDSAQGITDKAPLVTEAAVNMWDETTKQVKTKLGWDDATGRSAVFYELGLQVDQSIADGITDNMEVVVGALQNVFDSAISSLDLSGISAAINAKLGEALR